MEKLDYREISMFIVGNPQLQSYHQMALKSEGNYEYVLSHLL